MTIRKQLEMLGPEAVRAGMIAFEHRGDLPYGDANGTCPDRLSGGYPCCFVYHAFNTAWIPHEWAESKIENAFEGWRADGTPMTAANRIKRRAALRAECIAYLAEHGDAKEPVAGVSRAVGAP